MCKLQKSFSPHAPFPKQKSLLCKGKNKTKSVFLPQKVKINFNMSYFYNLVAKQNRQNTHKINTMALLNVTDSSLHV